MNLSKKEWIAVTIALIVVVIFFYPFFGKFFSSGSSVERAERNVIEEFNLSPEAKVNIKVLNKGEGEMLKEGDVVAFHYTGYLENGTIFGSTRDHGVPLLYQLGSGQLIPGFEQGLRDAHVGDVRVVTIPPKLAYGERGYADPSTGEYIIPPNSTLTFEVEILSVGR